MERSGFTCLVWFASFLYVCIGSDVPATGREMNNMKECALVQEQFVRENLGHIYLVPDAKKHDSEMETCYRGNKEADRVSCCTRKMEKHFLRAAQKDFYDVVQLNSESPKNLLRTQAKHLTEKFQELVQLAENNTGVLFEDVYKVPLKDRRSVSQALFMDIQAYLKRREVNLHESIQEFFDQLFPIVFHNILNDPSVTELNEDYRECLMESRQELYPKPFGVYPHTITHQLVSSIDHAKLLQDFISLGVEAMNVTENMPSNHECSAGLTRMKYCSMCDNEIHVKPCKGFCHNIMRGCLSHLLHVDTPWKTFMDSFDDLVTSIQGTNNIENVMQGLHSKISEAVMHAMEAGPKFYAQVVTRCGHPKTSQLKQTTRDAAQLETSVKYMNIAKVNTTLSKQLKEFLTTLKKSRSFFSQLADQMCKSAKFKSHKEQCWTGEKVGSYTKPVPEFNITEQLQNPEVAGGHRAGTDVMARLAQKLIDITGKQKRERMQGDDAGWNGFHKGRKDYGFPNDDSDFGLSGSGSGSGDGYNSYNPNVISQGKPNRPSEPEDKIGDNDGFEFVNKDKGPSYSTVRPNSNLHQNPGGAATHIQYSQVLVIVTLLVGILGFHR